MASIFLSLKDQLKKVGYEKIQFVTISRPSARGEYAPYHFVATKEEFRYAVEQMKYV